MFSGLIRLFRKCKEKKTTMDKNVNTASPGDGISQAVLAKVKIPRKFEIFVEEFDEEKGWRPVASANIPGMTNGNPIITVNSQADLHEKMALYKSMDQRFKIIREIDPPSRDEILKAAAEQGLNVDCQQPPAGPGQQQTPVVQATAVPTTAPVASPSQNKSKPKIVTIGDIQLKYDGDDVYQRQWVRLTPQETANFRIVSDSNNKLVSMNGRHIEAKKWVLVKNTSDDCGTEDIADA